MSPNAFVRERKLPLPRLVAFLLNAPRAGLQAELDAFFDHALGSGEARPVSKSALCQARRQLRPDALRDLLVHSAQLFAAHSPVPTWHGRRVLALDGSTLRVPDGPECAEAFGGMNTASGRFRPLARASALFDVARGAFVDAALGGFAADERSLARGHLPHLEPQDLLLMDRGYPSREWFHELNALGVAFCARISERTWTAVGHFARGRRSDAVADLGTAATPLSLRLLRVKRPNGSRLVLVTNLFDEALSAEAFADLYRARWRIEEAFKLIKARLQVENWSGILPHTVTQDFYASLLRANCAAVLALAARPEDAAVSANTGLDAKGWRVRLNRTLALKSLRHYLPRLLLALDLAAVLDRLVERLRSPTAVERTRPDRSAPRRKGVRIADFHYAYKTA
ncbi:Transposase, IS4-like [Aromatoleum bremense]|uniref:IS4 family transposase n=2 Tax=Aromatoleum bremense TaxID=76115 RepID=A0ABX1NRU8_9RHOO|nr:IS4 family transposase [Aromatoleum bremense]QTQ31003.1 Transposase, IS4-like [Aromatoleum bremense]